MKKDDVQELIDRDREKNVKPHAYGTGLSKRAHYEAQEAGRYDRQFRESMPRSQIRGKERV